MQSIRIMAFVLTHGAERRGRDIMEKGHFVGPQIATSTRSTFDSFAACVAASSGSATLRREEEAESKARKC